MDVIMPDAQGEETWNDSDRYHPEENFTLSTDEILTRAQLIDNNIKVVLF